MPEKIIEVSEEILKKKIKEGKIKFSGDPTDSSPIEGKPAEITTPVNTPINTLGGISTKGVGRKRFLVGGALALGGLAVTGIGLKTVEYLTRTSQEVIYDKISRTPFTTADLPPGWYQDLWPDGTPAVYEGRTHIGDYVLLSPSIYIHMGERHFDNSSRITFDIFKSSEIAREDLKLKLRSNIGSISDKAVLERFDHTRNGDIGISIAIVENVIVWNQGSDEQIMLNLVNSGVKYLARIGVTSKKS